MKEGKVENIFARKILDSAGEWTIQAQVILADGCAGLAAVPSGISEGQWEAKTVPAKEALDQIQKVILPKVKGREFARQEELDGVLANLACGANASLAVSLAFCRAAGTLTLPARITPPRLMLLLMEGGKHGSSALTIQEFLVVVVSVEEGVAAYRKLSELFKKRGWPITVGAEGGLSPAGITDEKALEVVAEALGKNYSLALDIAQSARENLPLLDLQQLVKNYPLVSLEDPAPDDDWDGWIKITASLPDTLIVADDLVATNAERIEKAAQMKACGAVVIKPDQRRTLTEVLEAVRAARENDLKVIISHRARETNDCPQGPL